MSISTGIFIRGQLVGVKNDSYLNKQTGESFPFQAIGIDILFVNSFGVESSITKEIRLSKDQSADAVFMRKFTDLHGKQVEVEIGIGDYKRLFVHSNNNIQILSNQPDLSKVS